MSLITDFTVEDIFKLPGRGIVITGSLKKDEDHGLKIGTHVKITRPDGTTIIGLVRGIDNFHVHVCDGMKGFGVLLSEPISKEEIPRGSKITIAE